MNPKVKKHEQDLTEEESASCSHSRTKRTRAAKIIDGRVQRMTRIRRKTSRLLLSNVARTPNKDRRLLCRTFGAIKTSERGDKAKAVVD
jgi:hypothetical protein